MRGPEPGMMNPLQRSQLQRNPEGNAAANKSALLEHVSHTMQYDLNIASRESKLLQGEKRALVVAAEAANQHSEAHIEMLEKERADAVTLVDRAQKKRDWAEHRLQQEEEETSSMRRKVAQVLSDAATDRQANEAKLEALRAHVKQQDVQISNLRHTHHIQRGEWEDSLKESARLRREREEELFKVHGEHSKVLEDKKAMTMNMRNEVHAHKEAIVGHIKDKEYLDSRLAQARDAHAEIAAKHDAMAMELSRAKAQHKATSDRMAEETMTSNINYETRIALLNEQFQGQKNSMIKDHETRSQMKTDDHQKRCSIFEDSLKKAKDATQARISEISRITQAADEAAALAARRQAQLELDLAEAKAQIGRIDMDLDLTRRNAKTEGEEKAKMIKMLEDALQDADGVTKALRTEMDRTRETMTEQSAEARREISRLEDELEGATSEIKAITMEKEQSENRLGARITELTKLKEREEWEHSQSKSRLEATARELMVTANERDELSRVLESTTMEMKRQKSAMEEEFERQVTVLNTEHGRKVDSITQTLRKTQQEVKVQEQLVGETRNEVNAQKSSNSLLRKEFDGAREEWREDRIELEGRLEKAEKARRRELVLKEKALTQEQEMHMQLLSSRGELEHSLKDTGRLRAERDEVTQLCEETHEKKEMYKKRLIDATDNVDTMSRELEFALNESNLLRQERSEAIKAAELVAWEKEMVESTLQEEIETVIEEKEEAEIQRDQAKRVLQKEVDLAKTLRKELSMSLRENDGLKSELEEVDAGVTTASLRVADLHGSQMDLLDNHTPEYVATKVKPIAGRNFDRSSLRQLGMSSSLGDSGWKEKPMLKTKQLA